MKKLSFNAAGVDYSNFAEAQPTMVCGTKARLVPEPDNKHDSQAVEIYYGDFFVGYVPSNLTLEEAVLHDHEFVLGLVNEFGFEVREV